MAAGKAAAEQVTALSAQLSTTRRDLEAAATAAEELGRERVISSASQPARTPMTLQNECRYCDAVFYYAVEFVQNRYLCEFQARCEGLEQRLARSRQESASASTLSADLEDRLRRAEDELESAAGVHPEAGYARSSQQDRVIL